MYITGINLIYFLSFSFVQLFLVVTQPTAAPKLSGFRSLSNVDDRVKLKLLNSDLI